MSSRQALWSGAGIVGVAAVTAATVFLSRRFGAPSLPVLYVLVVLGVGWRAGRWPAVATSVAAFVAYDFFLVPPIGTLTVATPGGLVELAVLLAAALVTGQLAASLDSSRSEAAAAAAEARQLYELAVDVLRRPDGGGALDLVCERAGGLAGVSAFSVLPLNPDLGGERSGRLLREEDAREAEWAFQRGVPVGCALREGELALMITHPAQPDSLAILPLTSGAVVVRARPEEVDATGRRLLASLAALSELLLERRRAAAEADRRHTAEVSDSLKAAVLSSLSHELKSPLASLRTGLTALAGDGLAAEQRELLLGLDQQALRLDRLVDDLLTMSSLEAGSPARPQPVSLAETAGAVLHRLGPRLAARTVVVDLPPDLPPLEADELQLERVLTNLLDNAIGWTSDGGRIEIGARATEAGVAAWVANDGPGIPPLELQSVFDKFWTRRAGGSGLGLAICKRIVEGHGGTIEARNLRAGPQFRLTWPAARPVEA